MYRSITPTASDLDDIDSNPAALVALAEASGRSIGAIPSRLLVQLCWSDGTVPAK